MAEPTTQEQETLRRAMFVPCASKAALHTWVRVYLGIDYPDCLVDPESTASPMDVLWEIYDGARNNRFTIWDSLLAYGSRGGFKTLMASTLETLAILHLERNVAHMAAIESQAKKCQSYVKRNFRRPLLRDFVTAQNERSLNVARYSREDTGENLTRAQWEALPLVDRDRYRCVETSIVVVLCTMAGANSEHVPLFVVDEIDVIPKQHIAAYEEAKHIPDPHGDQLPVTLYISTRKFSFGLVQKEIDGADESGLQIRHWNALDVTAACPADRHLPAEPRIQIYVDEERLRAIDEVTHRNLNVKTQADYRLMEGYAGCLKNCKMFSSCRGLLATKQTSRSKLLKPVAYLQSQFRKVSLEHALAQILCRKPTTTGLVYPRYSADVHLIPAARMLSMLTGEEPRGEVTREDLLRYAMNQGLRFSSGLDFGFVHNFVVVSAIIHGALCLVFDVISMAHLELDDKIALCQVGLPWKPEIWPDMENPESIQTFRRKGFHMRTWDKGAGSVRTGIDAMRSKLWPAVGSPTLYLLAGDPGCELLGQRLSRYHFELDAAGEVTEIPEKTEDDEVDGCRYLVQNVFPVQGKGKLSVSMGPTPDAEAARAEAEARQQYRADNWMSKIIQERIGTAPDGGPPAVTVGKRGRFSFSG